MSTGAPISFARGAPSLDIVDVERAPRGRRTARSPTTPPAPPPTARRSATCRCASGSPSSTVVAPSAVIVTNGSMQADAFLFDELVAPGDAVIVEKPTYDRTLLSLRERGADVRAVELEPRRDRRRRASRRSCATACGRSSPTSSPTSRTPPATRCRGRSATACSRWPPSTASPIFEDDPYVALRFARRVAARRCSTRTTARATSSTPRRSPRPSARASASGYLVGPEDLIAAIRRRATQHLHLAEHGRRVDRQRVRPLRAPSCARSRRSRRRSTSASTALADALERELPEAALPARPRAATSCGSSCRSRIRTDALFAAAAERGVAFVKGADFLLEGGEHALRLAYSGVTVEQVGEGVRASPRPPGRSSRPRA